ncbi:hypothetical protein LD110_09700 [Arthrobacter sp. M4]|nr:hypothetical protein [Arthrobacter sp. M4]
MRFAPRIAALVLAVLTLASCGTEMRAPDMSTRDEFANRVMNAASSGSVDQVERLVPQDRIGVRPGAQKLVDAARGWDPASWKVGLRQDVPEYVFVTVTQQGQTGPIRYEISWSGDRWGLILGTSKNRPSDGAEPGTPGTGTPKVIDPK